jgi:hypothetical protein
MGGAGERVSAGAGAADPGRAALGLTAPRLARAAELLERRLAGPGRGRTTPGLRTMTVVAATATLLLRRRRPRVTRVLSEGACPACLALGLVGGGGT